MGTNFKLQPNPVFKATVNIPRPGDTDGELTFTFKHRSVNKLAEMEKLEDRTVVDFLLEITDSWALPDEFSRDNLETLLDNYPGALRAITETYYAELLGNREKN